MRNYEIRVPHAASDTMRMAFPELQIIPLSERMTLLCGPVRDQSELHGLLARLADLGMDITEVREQPRA